MRWIETELCKGKDVFILGGGPSLTTFDLSRLVGRWTLGCNDAYLFGEAVVDAVLFGDLKWYEAHEESLALFENPVFTSLEKFEEHPTIQYIPRENAGFHLHTLGWNGHTGAAAINLALILGATRIFLLGFDMKLGEDGERNWHVNALADTSAEKNFSRFAEGIAWCIEDLRSKWPWVKVYNLNPESALSCFPRKRWEDFFKE